MKQTLLFILFCSTLLGAAAQGGRYVVQLRNKGQSLYTLAKPEQFLSARSIARRTRYQIAYDSTDLPVTPAYIDSIRTVPNITVLNVSKWLNQVSIQTTDAAALATINAFPFVQGTSFSASRTQKTDSIPESVQLKTASGIQAIAGTEQVYDYGAATAQVAIHNGAFLHNMGLQGQGMAVSLLDAGFYHYTTLKAFDSVNAAGQVQDSWDFVARERDVIEDNAHGMQCFSIMAANIPGSFIGTSPKATYALYRSEDAATEFPIEEHTWVCAAERADSAGSDVISSSLGYNTFNDPSLNHAYSDFTGRKTPAAIGATLAARKGLLVLISAGNSGTASWKYITTPADADSILAVGAVTTRGIVAPFSSYGPSADGRVKPDVASVGAGTVLQSSANTIVSGNGTSFACPNMAGLATCLWQGFPEYNNMKIIDALRRSGNQFETPDDRTGYGIPDLKKAVVLLLNNFATASIADCKTISWTSKDVSQMHYEIERRKEGDTAYTIIHTQGGTGTVFQTHTYQYTDETLSAADGLVRYRIRQVLDTSAAAPLSFYVDTLAFSLALTCAPIPASENGFQLLPNPARNILYVKMETNQPVQNLHLQITNALGQVVFSQRTTKPAAGIALFPLQVTGLSRGVYFVSVYDGGKQLATHRFSKL